MRGIKINWDAEPQQQAELQRLRQFADQMIDERKRRAQRESEMRARGVAFTQAVWHWGYVAMLAIAIAVFHAVLLSGRGPGL